MTCSYGLGYPQTGAQWMENGAWMDAKRWEEDVTSQLETGGAPLLPCSLWLSFAFIASFCWLFLQEKGPIIYCRQIVGASIFTTYFDNMICLFFLFLVLILYCFLYYSLYKRWYKNQQLAFCHFSWLLAKSRSRERVKVGLARDKKKSYNFS